MSQRMMEITIVAPPSKVLKEVNKKVSQLVCVLSCTEVIRLRQIAPITQPTVCTGDLTISMSDNRPIKRDPIMPPTEPRDVILVAVALS